MIDVYIVAALILVLVAGSARIGIEIYVRRRARAARDVGQGAESTALPPAADRSAAMGAEVPENRLTDTAIPADRPSPAALFRVEMGPAVPRLHIAFDDREFSVDIQPWQAATLGRSLIAASVLGLSSTEPPSDGAMLP